MTSHISLLEETSARGTPAIAGLIDDRYELIGVISGGSETPGCGGCAQTWIARDTRLHRNVSIDLDYSIDATSMPAEFLQRLVFDKYSDHVRVYDAGTHRTVDGLCVFVVTPYVEVVESPADTPTRSAAVRGHAIVSRLAERFRRATDASAESFAATLPGLATSAP